MTTRNDVMNFLRNEESLNTLSPDDRIEIFRTILLGSSDISKELLDDLLSDYDITHLKIINDKDQKQCN